MTWTIEAAIRAGYSTKVDSSDPACVLPYGGYGTSYTLNGTRIGCVDDPGFLAALNDYINSTIEFINPAVAADPSLAAAAKW